MEDRELKKLKKVKKSNKKGKLIFFFIVAVGLIGTIIYLCINFFNSLGLFRSDVNLAFSPNITTYGFSFNNAYYYSTGEGLKSANSKGKEINAETTAAISTLVRGMHEPMFLKSDKSVLAFDVGGKTAALFDESGIIKPFSFDREIINAKMTSNGRFLFIINDSSAKAVVRTYDSSGFEMFYWYSGTGYVVDAMLNGTKDTMAVITNEVNNNEINSKIFFFDLTQSEPFLQKTISGHICSYMTYFGNGCMIVCEDGLYYAADGGMIDRVMDFSDKKVREFKSFTNGDLLICYENQDGDTYTIEIFNTKGRQTKKFQTKAFDKISDISSDKFLVIQRKEAVSFSKNGRVLKTISSEFEIRNAVYFDNRVSILGNDSLTIK